MLESPAGRIEHSSRPPGRSAAWLARLLWEQEVAGSNPAVPIPETICRVGRLDDVDLTLSLPRAEAEERIADAQQRLLARRLQFGGLTGDDRLGPPTCVLFEGWDASG